MRVNSILNTRNNFYNVNKQYGNKNIDNSISKNKDISFGFEEWDFFGFNTYAYDVPTYSEMLHTVHPGERYGCDGVEYYRYEIELAKNMMDEKDEEKRRSLIEQDIFDEIWSTAKRQDGYGIYDDGAARVFSAICSLGITELHRSENEKLIREHSKKWVDKIELIRADLISAKASEELANENNKKLSLRRDVEHIEAINRIKEDELRPRLLDFIQARAEEKDVSVPNCVMLTGAEKSVNLDFIDWCGKNVNGQYIKTNPYEEDLDDVLEEAEENYQETGEWNLIYVEDMDKLINPKYSSKQIIAAMKAIMCAAAEDYHSTLIFASDNPEELDEIALGTNRVKKIDTSNVTDVEVIKKQDIEKRLEDKEYRKNSPLAAINDILTLCNQDEQKQVSFDVTYEQLEEIKNSKDEILKNLPEETKNEYSKIIDECIDNIWYVREY